jgi:hypothetical protein
LRIIQWNVCPQQAALLSTFLYDNPSSSSSAY